MNILRAIYIICACSISIHCNNIYPMQKEIAQKIVFFRGMSTLGKGDICRALIKQDPQWEIVSDDDCTMQVELEMCQKQFPKQYAAIANAIAPENLFHAIKRNEVCYTPKASEGKKQAAFEAISHIQYTNNQPEVYKKEELHQQVKNLVKDRILKSLKNKHHVVNDGWILNEADFHEFEPHYQVIKAYCYIPLDLQINALIKTTREAFETDIFKNRRSYWHILNSFERIFLTDSKEPALDTISQETLLYCLARMKPLRQETESALQKFTHQEMTTQEMEERRKKYLAHFGTNKEVHLRPDMAYDIIIKKTSDTDTPQQKAQELLKFIEGKNH